MINEKLLSENLIPFLREQYPLRPIRYYQVNSEYFVTGLTARNFEKGVRAFKEAYQDISVDIKTETSLQVTRIELNLYYINKRDKEAQNGAGDK